MKTVFRSGVSVLMLLIVLAACFFPFMFMEFNNMENLQMITILATTFIIVLIGIGFLFAIRYIIEGDTLLIKFWRIQLLIMIKSLKLI